MTTISERRRACLDIYKMQKKCETFLYTKIQALCKKQDNLPYVFIYKNPDTLHYAIFHEMLEIGIFIQKV